MKKINAICEVKLGKLKLQNKFSFENSVSELPDGKYKLTLEKNYNKASNLQFGYLYGVVYPHSIIALIQSGEEDVKTVEEADTYWKGHFANKKIVNRDTGEIITLPISKSKFKTIDEMAYCDQIRNFCAEYLDYFITEADPDYKKKNKQVEKQIKTQKP